MILGLINESARVIPFLFFIIIHSFTSRKTAVPCTRTVTLVVTLGLGYPNFTHTRLFVTTKSNVIVKRDRN